MRSRLALAATVLLAPCLLCLPLPRAPVPAAEPIAAAISIQKWGFPDALQCGVPTPLGVAAYDGRLRTSRYVLEVLRAGSWGRGEEAGKGNHFRADAAWPVEFRAATDDYRAIAGTYDRGHLAPAGDFDAGRIDATYVLSNVAPQHAQLNRGLWRRLEAYLREVADRDDVLAVWVVTLPLFLPDDLPPQGTATDRPVTYRVAGPNHVPIPTHFGKAALIENRDGRIALRNWLVPNAPLPPNGGDLAAYRVTADFLEHWGGIDLWEGLDDALENALERVK